jgi:osmotically-inducible protein OsmY
VAGVVGVVNDVEVRLPIIHRRPDPEIARDAVEALKRELPFSWERIKVVVEDGWMTLEGKVEWHYQREWAEEAVWGLRGVRGVTNKIEASRLSVEANGSEIILRGTVRSWAEREQAERAAWSAPGISKVDNRIRVEG